MGGNLNQPLGLAIAPNGDILSVNAGDGNIIETAPGGSQVAVKNIDTSGAGAGTLPVGFTNNPGSAGSATVVGVMVILVRRAKPA